MTEFEKLYTVREVAATFSVSTQTVKTWLRDGYLKGRKIGRGNGQWRVPESEVRRIAEVRHGA